jgi:hypothetical protein
VINDQRDQKNRRKCNNYSSGQSCAKGHQNNFNHFKLVAVAGLEPARHRWQQILSL